MALLPSEEIKIERLEFRLTEREKRMCIRRMIEEDGGKVNLFARRILLEYLDGKLILNPGKAQIVMKLNDQFDQQSPLNR